MSSIFVTKRVCQGDRFKFKLLTTESGITSAMTLMKYPALMSVYDEELQRVEINNDALFALIMTLDKEDLEYLLEVWLDGAELNNESVSYDDLFAGNYELMLTCLKEIFVENYSVFFSFTAKPFEKPQFRYDSVVDSIYNTSITESAVKKMAQMDMVTEIIHSVYFSQLCKESLQYLKDMTLSDFWKLKTAIEIRESAKQEVDNRQYNVQKSTRK